MDQKAIIYENLLNGCSQEQVARDFHKTLPEINAIFRLVSEKIKIYLFKRRRPAVLCDALYDARRNRIELLMILPKLNLSIEPTLKIRNDGFDLNDLQKGL